MERFIKHPTSDLLKVQTKLRIRMIDRGELSARDSVLYLALTQTLDSRCASKDPVLV
jgi:hypothetical protein